jgi:hypothetical protein
MERCGRCILPRNYAAVTFEDDGVCSLCRDYENTLRTERVERGIKQTILAALVSKSRHERGKYNCIVPVSGGQDSSYVAFVMKRLFHFRVLGLNFDNDYRSDLALRNLEQLSRNLEIDIITLKINPALLRRLYAHFFKTCGYFCTVCNALGYLLIGSFAAREARLNGASPLVVGGWSKKYEYQPDLSVFSMKAFAQVLMKDEGLFSALRESLVIDSSVFDTFLSAGDIRQMEYSSLESRRAGESGICFIQLPDYMDWDYREISKILEREVGWKKSADGRDAHFDCLLAPLQEYLKHRKFGFSQQAIKNSVLIREGQMSREEALRKSDMEQTTEPAILKQVLSEWEMSIEDVAWDSEWAE